MTNTDALWGTAYEQQLIESAGDSGCGQRDIDLNATTPNIAAASKGVINRSVTSFKR